MLMDQRDPLGRRRVRVQWSPGALELRSLRRAHELLDQALRRSGLGRLEPELGGGEVEWPASLSGACHHIGTTRMHSDPRRGVTDPDCRVHGMTNLYLAGSSVFPTAGYANPTLTIVALALRLGEALGRGR
jgi:choline dehydrogenase-like flavoprotein